MTVVFLHPIALDGASWQFVRPHVPEGSVFVDLPGHGARSVPSGRPTLDDFARDVLDAVEGELDVVGLSLGGAVALRMALLRPERVRSALLASSGAGGAAVRHVLRSRAEETARLGMGASAEATLRRWFTPAALDTPGHPGVTYASGRLDTASAAGVAAAWLALAELDAWDELPSVSVPTTVVHATEDPTGSLESRRQMAERIPGARFTTVPGSHMAHLEQPTKFAAAVCEHLGRVAG